MSKRWCEWFVWPMPSSAATDLSPNHIGPPMVVRPIAHADVPSIHAKRPIIRGRRSRASQDGILQSV